MDIVDIWGKVLFTATAAKTIAEAVSAAIKASANLYGANLRSANLRSANLYGANLYGADLGGADLKDSRGVYLIVPEVGSFVAFKKVKTPAGDNAVLRVRIDADVPRVSYIAGRKCRAERVYVLAVESGPNAEHYVPHTSPEYDANCRYVVGEYTVAHDYNDDPRVECTGGIHYFITKAEAEAW